MTRTAADICRERGWGEGTVIENGHGGSRFTITAIGRENVLVVGQVMGEQQVAGDISHWQDHVPDPRAELVQGIAERIEANENQAAQRCQPRLEPRELAECAVEYMEDVGACFHPDHQGDGILSALIAGLDDFFVCDEDLILRYDGAPAAFAALERFESAYDRETEQP